MPENKHAAEVRQIRETLGLTQEEFAKRLGVFQPQVSSWESGRVNPSRLMMEAIRKLKAD